MSLRRLPHGWEWRRLGEVATIDSNLVSPADHESMPHIAPNHIESWTGRLLPYTTVAADKVTSPKHLFRPGHIIYSKIRPYLAKAVLVEFSGLCSADMYPISTSMDSGFLLRWLLSPEFTDRVTQDQGRTVLPKVNQEALLRTDVPVPPIEVQRRIVAKLDALLAQTRAAREQLEAVPALVEKYRQSVLAAAFRGDLTAEWRKKNPNVEPASKLLERIRAERRKKWEEAELAKMKAKGKAPKDDKWKAKYVEPEPVDASGLPELPPTWVWVSIGEIGDVETGFTPSTKESANFGGEVPFFKPTDLDQGYRVTKAREFLSKKGAALGRELPPGSVLVTCIGATIGKTGLARVKCATNQQINAIVPADGVSSGWLYWVLTSPQEQDCIVSNASATTLPIINKTRFAGLPIPLPSSEEQVRVAGVIEGLVEHWDAGVDGLAVEGLVSLERALLAKAFSGELVESTVG